MDSKLTQHEGALLASVERRLFLRRGLSLGALSLLSGCDLTYDENVQKVLTAMSKWNDGAQAWLFDPKRLAPEFPVSMITDPFPFNAYYAEEEVRQVDANSYKLEVGGLVLFVLVHVAMVALVPKTFLTMITGRLKNG